MAVDFENCRPIPDDHVQIGLTNLEDGDSWPELGSSCK